MASGLLAAAILWALVLIGLFTPPPPKPNGPVVCTNWMVKRG